MIIDPNLATKIQESVELLENNVREFAESMLAHPENLRKIFKKDVVDLVAEIRDCLTQLISDGSDTSTERGFPLTYYVLGV